MGSGAGNKRKASADYSENQHSKKARQRLQDMDDDLLDLERAKKAFNAQKNRKIADLKKKDIWQNGSASERHDLEQAAINTVIDKA